MQIMLVGILQEFLKNSNVICFTKKLKQRMLKALAVAEYEKILVIFEFLSSNFLGKIVRKKLKYEIDVLNILSQISKYFFM